MSRETTTTIGLVLKSYQFTFGIVRWSLLLLLLRVSTGQSAIHSESWISSHACLNSVFGLRGGGSGSRIYPSYYLWSTLLPSTPLSSKTPPKSRASTGDYTKSLEDQIAFMDQQLRQAHAELALLKAQWTKRKQAAKDTARQGIPKQNSRQKQQLKSLQLELSSVQSQVQVLEKLKESLEAKLAEQRVLSEKLASKIRDGKIDEKLKQRLENDFERRVEELRHQHELETQRQLAKYEELMETQMAAAAEQAHQEVMATMDAKIEAARQSVMLESERELELERKRASASVEKQRSKMRALAKAMAIRETKLYNLEKKKRQKMQQEQNEELLLVAAQLEKEKRMAEQQVEETERRIKMEKEKQEAEDKARIEAAAERQRAFDEEKERLIKLEQERQSEAMKLAHEQAVARNLERKSRAKATGYRWRPPGFRTHYDDVESDEASKSKKGRNKKGGEESLNEVTVANVKCWQRRVPWQPLQLPPSSVVKLSFTDSS